ncbi:signal peptidase I [Longimicrobium sp.]|uniref:signal peptidase I n=1 Tax=Longimicrobium sp. TaxID=2029185 RepID=UPI003B3B650E
MSNSRSRNAPNGRPLPAGNDAASGDSVPATPAAASAEQERRAELKGILRGKDRSKKAKKDAKPASNDNGGPLEGLKSILVAVLLFFVIRTFIVTAYSIPSESMEETLLVGDYLMANNALFGATIPFTDIKLPALRDPRRGEIVVFRPTYNEPQIDVVKRVIGVPGDTLQMANGQLFRNGDRVNERYAHHDQAYDDAIPLEGFGLMDPTIRPEAYGAKNHLPLLLSTVDPRGYQPTRNSWGPLVVPAGHYWLMGDNRDQSLDSRFMGPIPRRTIRGKPLFIYYSFDKQLGAPFPAFVTAARWKRIGTPIH